MIFNYYSQLKTYYDKLQHGDPNEVALGAVFGLFLGLVPASINSFIISLFIMILKVDKPVSFIFATLIALVGFILDPLAHIIGYFVLVQVPFLKPIWTALYNMPVLPLTGFNNTVVMGNTVLGLLLMVPTFRGAKKILALYRASNVSGHAAKIFDNPKLNKFVKFFNLGDKIKGTVDNAQSH